MRIHPVTGQVAYDDSDRAGEAAWVGDARFFQWCRDVTQADGRVVEVCSRVLVYPDGRRDVLLPDVGANACRGGRYGWLSRLDEPRPTLRSSAGGLDGVQGFEGAVAADSFVLAGLNLDKDVALVRGHRHVDIPLPGGVFGDPWIDQTGTWLIATCFPGPRLVLVSLETGEQRRPVCLTPEGHYTPACVVIDGQPWVIYHTDAFGLVIHPDQDPTRRLMLAPPPTRDVGVFGVDACVIREDVHIRWGSGEGQHRSEERGARLALDVLRALRPTELPGLPTVPPATPPAQPPSAPPQTPAPQPLSVTIDAYTSLGTVPMSLVVDYRVDGAGGAPVTVGLLLNGAKVASTDRFSGRLTTEIHEAGEYRLQLRVTSGDRTPAQTERVRIVRVDPAPATPPPVVDTDPAVHLIRTAATHAIQQLYLDILGRPADPEGLAHYIEEVIAGRLDIPGVRAIVERALEQGQDDGA